MNVIEIVKAKLEATEISDAVLKVHIEEIGQTIKSYCNRDEIPSELTFVHANMVVDLIRSEQKEKAPDENRLVNSIKEGDVQVSFGSVRSTKGEAVTDDLLHNYTKQLLKFRKVRW